jgi:hypothetical protein
LYNAKLNKSEEVPLADHVVKLVSYLENEVEEDYNAFNKKPGRENGRKLAEDLLTQIIVFNKRRGGEASRFKVDTYLDVKKKCEDLKLIAELYCSLDEDEKMMANSHLLIRTIGKCGTHVPIILTRKMKSAVDVLVADRKKLDFRTQIHTSLEFQGATRNLKAWTILNAICKKLNLPGIASTSLRKYLATTAQSLDLCSQQIGWMSHHLGHSIDVHNKYYQKHDRVIELGKITKLLHASQEGSLHKNRGKTIETMEVAEWDLHDYPIDRIDSDGSNENAGSAQSALSSADEEPQGPSGRTGTKSRKKNSSSKKKL